MPTGVYLRPSIEERFWDKVNKTDNCWEWLGCTKGHGYGNFWYKGRQTTAHRIAYILVKGDVPKGLHIDHLCRNRACVNPEHLEAVTQQENILRGVGAAAVNARKTHCNNGHKYTKHNTYTLYGYRSCLICKKARRHEHYLKTGN